MARLLVPAQTVPPSDPEKEARWHGRRALALAPASAEAWWTQAALAERDERLPDALEAIDRALMSTPVHPELWLLKSEYLARLGRSEEALTAVSAALDLSNSGIEIRSRALRDRSRTTYWEPSARPLTLEPGLTLAWSGPSPSGARGLLCKMVWNNPEPEAELRSLDFVSAMTDSFPFLVAITAE